MGFNRPEAKFQARNAMRGAYPHPMLVTLVYVLLTSVLASAIMYFVNNPFQIAYMYLLDGIYDPETIFHYVFLPGRVALYAVLELLISLYTCVMGFGYTSYSLRLARGEQPGYRNLMDGFARIGRVLICAILISVFTGLWTLLAMIPYLAVMILAAVLDSGVLIALAVVLCIAGVVRHRGELPLPPGLLFAAGRPGYGEPGGDFPQQAGHARLEGLFVRAGSVLPWVDSADALYIRHFGVVAQPLYGGR